MKKIALGLVLALLSSGVFAKWEKIASSADGKVTYYAKILLLHKRKMH